MLKFWKYLLENPRLNWIGDGRKNSDAAAPKPPHPRWWSMAMHHEPAQIPWLRLLYSYTQLLLVNLPPRRIELRKLFLKPLPLYSEKQLTSRFSKTFTVHSSRASSNRALRLLISFILAHLQTTILQLFARLLGHIYLQFETARGAPLDIRTRSLTKSTFKIVIMAQATSGAAGLLARQLKYMQAAKDLPGISCGLVNNNVFEWEVMLMISDDCKYYGGKHPPSNHQFSINIPQVETFVARSDSHQHIRLCLLPSHLIRQSHSILTSTLMADFASRFYTHPRKTNMDTKVLQRDGHRCRLQKPFCWVLLAYYTALMMRVQQMWRPQDYGEKRRRMGTRSSRSVAGEACGRVWEKIER